MAGIGGAAAVSVSTPSLCRCSAPQSSSVSGVLASSPSFQHLIRVPRRCSVHLPRPDRSCSSSSHSGVSLRFVNNRTNSRQLASLSPFCNSSSLEKSVAVQESVSAFTLRKLGAFCAGSLVAGTAGAALADNLDVIPPCMSGGTPTDYFLSLLFLAASTGLALRTNCDAPKRVPNGAQTWRDTELSKVLAPIVASAGFYWQASASALEDVVKVEDPPLDLIVVLVTSGIYAGIYLFVIPAVIYNYLRLRWYKRNAAETFFQFMLVFIFFPGMLLLAPFINFRRLPKEGAEPP